MRRSSLLIVVAFLFFVGCKTTDTRKISVPVPAVQYSDSGVKRDDFGFGPEAAHKRETARIRTKAIPAARLAINTGSSANDGTGDSVRVALGKANTNFVELYSNLTIVSNLAVIGGSGGAKLTISSNLSDVANPAAARQNLGWTTIYATDPQFGAVGDYSGDMTTAGSGTDNRAAIQAALDAAHTAGASFGDVLKGSSHRVVLTKGKYYISARSDGMPSLRVPLKVDFDFGEAELHFQLPLRNYTNNGITEPNPAWCGILVGQMAGLKIGRMLSIWGQDPTYGGTWYGMTLDAIRVQESDISWIRGDGNPHQIFNFRGAGIRYIACWNAFVSDLSIANTAYGIVMSYFGNAFSAYTRYRGTNDAENVSVNLWASRCSFLNIYRTGIYTGAGGDWHNPGSPSVASGGLEEHVVDGRAQNGGPISVTQCAFENVAFGAIRAYGSVPSLFVTDCRMEECDDATTSVGVIYGNGPVKVDGLHFGSTGLRSITLANYNSANSSVTCVPMLLVRCDGVDTSPLLQNVFVANTANNSSKLVSLSALARLPTIINYRTSSAAQMQGTGSDVQNIIFENDGGRIWSISTVGIAPTETVNGSNTTFTFPNGSTRQKPKTLRQDGLYLQETNSDGSTNWSWDSGTTTVTTSTAPTKDLRAFY